jgi:hypothetical protein
MEMLKQHLPLSNIGAVEFCGQQHLQAWQIKAERDNTQKLYERMVCALWRRLGHSLCGSSWLAWRDGQKMHSIQLERWP